MLSPPLSTGPLSKSVDFISDSLIFLGRHLPLLAGKFTLSFLRSSCGVSLSNAGSQTPAGGVSAVDLDRRLVLTFFTVSGW